MHPQVIVFDVIGTLCRIDPLAERLESIGLKGELLSTWFARLLRDGFALAAAGSYAPFQDVASAALEGLAAEHGQSISSSDAAKVVEGFAELPAYSDVEPSLRRLEEAGVRLAALTNGSEKNTKSLLRHANIDAFFERVVSVDEVERWKPRPEPYLHAAKALGVRPQDVLLVAAHSWDIGGAKRAGLRVAWVARKEKKPSPLVERPDLAAETLNDVVDSLTAVVR